MAEVMEDPRVKIAAAYMNKFFIELQSVPNCRKGKAASSPISCLKHVPNVPGIKELFTRVASMLKRRGMRFSLQNQESVHFSRLL